MSVAPPPLSEKRLKRREKRREALEMADVSTIGTVFPMAILIGLFGGRTIGGFFGYRQAGTLIGLGVGIVSGFYNLYKVIQKVTPNDIDDIDLVEVGESGPASDEGLNDGGRDV